MRYSSFLMARMAPFSRRLTWAWDMPICAETSIWVFPWLKRIIRMLRSRGVRRLMASFRAMRWIQLSSVQRRSLTWSMTHTVSPPSEYMGSYRDTGSTMASMASTTSSRGMASSWASCSTVGSR